MVISLQGGHHGKPSEVIHVVETEEPASSEGQVIIELVASPINPSDIMLIKGLYPRKIDFPMTFGTEGIGRVTELGEGVDTVQKGDLVLIPLGTNAWKSKMGVPAKRLFPLPPSDVLQMAMISVNPPTAYLMLKKYVGLETGDWVIQNAANSAVGRYIIQLSKILGYRTINIVRRSELVEELKEIGADVVIVDGPDMHGQLRDFVGNDEIKLGIDAVSGEASDRMIRCLSPRATLVVYGAMSLKPITLNMAVVMAKDLTIRSFWLTHWLQQAPREEIQQVYSDLMKMIANKQLFAKIEATYQLRDCKKALEHADSEAKGGKVLFIGKQN